METGHDGEGPADGLSNVTSSLLSLLIEQSGEAIIMADPKGRVRLFNAEAERQYGIGREEAMRPGWAVNLPLFDAEDGSPLAPEQMPMARALRGERLERVRWRVRLPDGAMRTLSGTAAPLKSQSGELLGAVLLSRDETEQVALEKTLHDEELSFHQAMTAALEEAKHAEWWARYVADASRIFNSSLNAEAILQQLSNLAVPTLADFCAVELLRGEGTELVAVSHVRKDRIEEGWAFNRRFPTNLARQQGVAEVVRSGKSQLVREITPEFLAQSGMSEEQQQAVRELGLRSYVLVPLIARGHTLGVLMLIFTTESNRTYSDADVRRAEDLAQRAALAADNGMLYRQSQEAIRLRDEFLSVASHELKTPLTPLQLRVEALLQDGSKGGNQAQVKPETLDAIRRQVRKLATLIDGLLDVSRMRAGRLELQFEELDLVPVVLEVVQRFGAQAAQAGCEVTIDAPAPVRGEWDRLRIEQIVTNLFTNAIKYGAGQPVEVTIRKAGDRALIRVRDFGIGIPDVDVKRIFERFERAVSERHYGGLGLGLYITRQIVRALGGRIHVESTPGRGALFEVALPIRG